MNTIVNKISENSIISNIKQYKLFFFSIIFSISMVGTLGILQYSKTIRNVFAGSVSTQEFSLAMFFLSIIGIFAFILYANKLYLKHKSKEIATYLSHGMDRNDVYKLVLKDFNSIFQIATLIGLLISIPIGCFCWSIITLLVDISETTFYIGWFGIIILLMFTLIVWYVLILINRKYVYTIDVYKVLNDTGKVGGEKDKKMTSLNFASIIIPIGIVVFLVLHSIGHSLISLLVMAIFAYILYVIIKKLVLINDIFE